MLSLRGMKRLAAILVASALAPELAAQSLSLSVTSAADSGPGTLRWAIENATGTSNSIVFQQQVDGIPIQLESPLPPITRMTFIRGRYPEPIIDGTLVTGDGIWLHSGTIQNIHTRNFKSGAGIVLGSPGAEQRAAALNVVATGNLVGVRLTAPDASLDFSIIRANATGIVADSTATGIRIGLPPNLSGIATPPSSGGSLITNNDLGIEWNGEGALVGNDIYANGLGVMVAGTSTHAFNRILNNTGGGIAVFGTAKNLHRDVFFGNGGLGIDLGGDGLDPIDVFDSDSGPHGRLNRPVLDVLEKSCLPDMSECALVVRGRLDAEPNTTYDVAVQASASCSPSGYGEGPDTYSSRLPTAEVRTDPSGHASFVSSRRTAPAQVWAVSALNVDGLGASSEFSNCIDAAIPTSAGGSNDLAISASGPAEAAPGETIRYRVEVTNAGSFTAFFRIATSKNSAAPVLGFVESIAPGQVVVAETIAVAELPGPLSPGVTFTWTVNPEKGTDPDMTNNAASLSTVIKEPEPEPEQSRRRAVRRGPPS
jgi:hypothetical protein